MAQAVVGTTLAANTLDLNAPDLGAAYLPQNQDSTLAGQHDSWCDFALDGFPAPVPAGWARSSRRGRAPGRSSIRFKRRSTGGSAPAGRLGSIGRGACARRGTRAHRCTCSTRRTARSPSGPARRTQTSCSRTSGTGRTSSRGTSSGSCRMLEPTSGTSRVLAAIVNDWQLSGVLTAGSGQRRMTRASRTPPEERA